MEKKLSAVQLSGLTIGPILGSGIILLPPMAYVKMGPSVIYLWILIMVLGGLFGWIFSGLSLKFPGDGGVMNTIEGAFGERYKNLSSLFLMSAVTSGPVAVMYTAALYLQKIFGGSVYVITGLMIVLAFIMLQMKLKNIGNISFVISTLTALLLGATSVYVLLNNGPVVGSVDNLSVGKSLNMLMLLFWAIIGWEIIGVYSDAVDKPEKTIPLSTLISLVIISFVYVIVALAYQSLNRPVDFIDLLNPLFGSFSSIILALLITGLCLCTYLLVVGAAVRLLLAFSQQGLFPKVFNKKTKEDTPLLSIGLYTLTHMVMVVFLASGIVELEHLIAIANGFFIANAWIGVLAAFKVLDSFILKAGSILLLVCFSALFMALPLGMIALIFVMTLLYIKPWQKAATKKVFPN